ncbi:hypothetical protein RND71_028483 [Anisodus tanguticus]|uniref:Uncharacterized protein n=1 Tax=Anisodus tanguticus TaxID=243964 RepID=A0AAE1RJW2_9SOLA|nr:hypothetical protein RND71_028483 [Anisodus tanguticus]
MSKVRGRTEYFKDVAHRSALSLGYDELESIGTLEQFLMKHKKDYVDLHHTTEQERDRIEHEVTIFVKSCKEQIDVLRNSINEEDANSKGWLGLKGDNFNADTIAYKHGVVLISSEKPHSVKMLLQFDQLRAIRFKDAINRVTPRRKHKNTTKSNAAETSVSSSLDPDMKRDSEVSGKFADIEDVVLANKQLVKAIITIYSVTVLLPTVITHMMQVELNSLLDSVQETETKMVEMSALNHLMSSHVLQQAQQIELLYEQAVEATQNVELGNKELSQAIQRTIELLAFLLGDTN